MTCTRCKKAQATEGRRRCEPCARYARRWDANHESAPPRVHGIRSESLRPVQLIGAGVALGLEVVTFEVMA